MPSLERKIPSTMSTQHPGNVFAPSWVKAGGVLEGDDEVYEAYYVFRRFLG